MVVIILLFLIELFPPWLYEDLLCLPKPMLSELKENFNQQKDLYRFARVRKRAGIQDKYFFH